MKKLPADFCFDVLALAVAGEYALDDDGIRLTPVQVKDVIRTYLDSLSCDDDKNFSAAMIEAKEAFVARCAAQPDECPQLLWERTFKDMLELQLTELAGTAA